MNSNHLNNMTNEKAALLEVLYRQPRSVDMEDILSVHDDIDFNAAFQKLRSCPTMESSHEPLLHDNTFYADTAAQKSPQDVVTMNDEFLVSLEKNRRNVSGRLRYAYLSDTDAALRGIDLKVVARLRRIMDKVEEIYCNAGGNASRLKRVILNGSGNSRKNYIPFLNEGYEDYGNNYRLVRWGKGAGLPGITAADFIGSILMY